MAARNKPNERDEDLSKPSGKVDWEALARTSDFKGLVKAKILFVVPAFLFFVTYYFLLPILVGFAPEFMSTPVFGKVNLAYLFALSQFFMAWAIAGLYVRKAAQFDRQAEEVLKHHHLKKGGK